MKKRRIIRALCIGIIVALLMPGKMVGAATKLSLNDSWEDLYVETCDLEQIYNQPYAKLSTNVSDIDEYFFNLTSDTAGDKFRNALTKSKIKYDADYTCGFAMELWQYTDDDDKKLYKGCTVYVPIPDDAQEHPEDCKFYKVSGTTATAVNTTYYVDEYDVYYVKLTVSNQSDYSPIYGFVYNDPDSYEDDDDDDWDPTPTPKPKATATPKPKATATPTPKAATKAPTKAPTKAATKAPTKAPAQQSQVKDQIPKTADEFPLEQLIIIAGVSVSVLAAGLYLLRRK